MLLETNWIVAIFKSSGGNFDFPGDRFIVFSFTCQWSTLYFREHWTRKTKWAFESRGLFLEVELRTYSGTEYGVWEREDGRRLLVFYSRNMGNDVFYWKGGNMVLLWQCGLWDISLASMWRSWVDYCILLSIQSWTQQRLRHWNPWDRIRSSWKRRYKRALGTFLSSKDFTYLKDTWRTWKSHR